MREGAKLSREILRQPAFDPYRGVEIQPGDNCVSDTDIDAFVRAEANSAYHVCGTCKMGSDDRAVVDPTLTVRGITGLRVVDASIMPTVVSGNLNSPTIMIAEKAADLILGKIAPAPIEAAIAPPVERIAPVREVIFCLNRRPLPLVGGVRH